MTTKKIDLSPLALANAQLHDALRVWHREPTESDLKKHLRASVIQAFEFTYELSAKMLRRVLMQRAASQNAIEDLSFNDMLRKAADAGLILSVNDWRFWRELRNATSHTYDEAKATEVARSCDKFFVQASALYLQLAAKQKDVE